MIGIPRPMHFGKNQKYRYLCMQPLGPSIHDLVEFCGGKLSAKTTLLVGKQIFNRLQDLHALKIIHQDIKPKNIVIGLDADTSMIHLIDFGISEYYLDELDAHAEMKRVDNFMGTVRFASINAHELVQLSRRDDLESLAYMLIHVCKMEGLEWDVSKGL